MRYSRLSIFTLSLFCYLVPTVAQKNNTDVTKLDPATQLLNASIQVIDLISEPKDAEDYLPLIPQLSPFALSQIDSFDICVHKGDTIFYTVYAQNDTHYGANDFLVTFVDGRKNIKLNPTAYRKNEKSTIDRKRFDYDLAVKEIEKTVSILPNRPIKGKRYLLQKEFEKAKPAQPKHEVRQPLMSNTPLIFELNK